MLDNESADKAGRVSVCLFSNLAVPCGANAKVLVSVCPPEFDNIKLLANLLAFQYGGGRTMNLTGFATSGDRPPVLQSPSEDNKLRLEDRAAHDWYRFVLSYPAHLVRTYLDRFGLEPGQKVLDPFCGTGTTLVECKKLGFASCGIEPNPMAAFASQTKIRWDADPDELTAHADKIAKLALQTLSAYGIEDEESLPLFGRREKIAPTLRTLAPDLLKLLLTDSISPLPLHKTIVLLETLQEHNAPRLLAHEHLALAKALVSEISNLHFGPEIGVGAIKEDAGVVGAWLRGVKQIASDLRKLNPKAENKATVHQADARDLAFLLEPSSIDAVITSPPIRTKRIIPGRRALNPCCLASSRAKMISAGLSKSWSDPTPAAFTRVTRMTAWLKITRRYSASPGPSKPGESNSGRLPASSGCMRASQNYISAACSGISWSFARLSAQARNWLTWLEIKLHI
jgi:hypothetical protein